MKCSRADNLIILEVSSGFIADNESKQVNIHFGII